MKKKVAIIIPSLKGGGAERVVVNISNNLDLKKIDLRLIVLKKEGPYLNDISNDVEVIDLNANRVRYSLIKLIKCINQFKPDVVLSTLGHLNLAIILVRNLLLGNPKIIVREASTPSKSLEGLSSIKKAIFFNLYKRLYPKADIIVAQCKSMKEDIVETYNIDSEKIEYIYNPIDLEKIVSLKAEFNPYSEDKKNIVAVGRLSPEKDYENLIKAYKIVNNQIKNTHLTILGEGVLKNELIELVRECNLIEEVSFLGFQSNPYPYLNYSDLYVLSSKWEGFPNTLLEALACGTRVVSTNCKSGPKEILGDNQYGILVPVEDHIALAEAIIETIDSENRTKDGAIRFDVKNIIKEYEKLFYDN